MTFEKIKAIIVDQLDKEVEEVQLATNFRRLRCGQLRLIPNHQRHRRRIRHQNRIRRRHQHC